MDFEQFSDELAALVDKYGYPVVSVAVLQVNPTTKVNGCVLSKYAASDKSKDLLGDNCARELEFFLRREGVV